MKVKITPIGLAKALGLMILLLLTANLFTIYLRFVQDKSPSFLRTFYFNAEGNIPTLYSFVALLLCGGMLWMISRLPSEAHENAQLRWRILALAFVVVAFDELLSFHETLTGNGRAMLRDFDGSGLLHFAWVVPYAGFFLFLFAFLVPFMLRLPVKTKMYFALAALTFGSGAVGMEMIGGRYIALKGDEARDYDLGYALLTTVEELLEMVGVVIFLYALLGYYIQRSPKGRLRFKVSILTTPVSVEEKVPTCGKNRVTSDFQSLQNVKKEGLR